ncbi:MAG TPA: UDP-3-O-(3-hydroxymyristoyl)glucosamine N-acyltransferase [Bacteroidaceae bacterium]|nr:UDP-3-O-(3-hydroxymyristoyl)glucosamine N-acyltransferase [Bacteroidaceae bacterium]
MELSAKQIAEYLQGDVEGDEKTLVNSFAKIEEGKPGALSFLSNLKYVSYLYQTKSSIVLVDRSFIPEKPISTTLIKVDNAYQGIAKLLSLYESMKDKKSGISPLAHISESTTIGEDVYIGPFAYIGKGAVVESGTQIYPMTFLDNNVKVGKNCIIYSHVTVYQDCLIGNNCIIHSGSVIGADGFGFAPSAKGYTKIPQIGIVELEDNVEIGANSCIDRATMGKTVIHKGVKLDNMVQIAHNVEVGENTVMSAQCGVAGSTKIGSWCMFGGQCGIAGHIKIGDKITVGAQSGISGHKKDGVSLMGYPAIEHGKFARSAIIFKKLPEMFKELDALKKEVEELKLKLE